MATTISVYPAKEHVKNVRAGQAKWQKVTLLSVLAYETLGCLSGGGMLALAPDGRLMKMPVDMMHGVFPDFLIPGIILIALGILNAIALVAVLRRSPSAWLMAGLANGSLIVWFMVEIAILQGFHWLHAMWGLPVILGFVVALPLAPARGEMIRIALLSCGILASLLYAAMNVFVPYLYEGYSSFSQAVSELSAIGAPTRELWMWLGFVFDLFFVLFGLGVFMSSSGNRHLRVVGIIIILYGTFIAFWPPMHQRGAELTLSDTLHVAWAMGGLVLMMLMMGFGAAAFGKFFRIYTIVTIFLLILFGVLTTTYASDVGSNLPTPWMGVWERLNILVFLLWASVLSMTLLMKRTGSNNPPSPTSADKFVMSSHKVKEYLVPSKN